MAGYDHPKQRAGKPGSETLVDLVAETLKGSHTRTGTHPYEGQELRNQLNARWLPRC